MSAAPLAEVRVRLPHSADDYRAELRPLVGALYAIDVWRNVEWLGQWAWIVPVRENDEATIGGRVHGHGKLPADVRVALEAELRKAAPEVQS